MHRYLIKLTLVAMVALFNSAAFAGSTAATAPTTFTVEEIAAFSKQVEKTMAAKGARVFIVGRLSHPESDMPEGINYTHVGIGVYSMIPTQDGRVLPGYTIHNLYQGGEKPEVSTLVNDFPVDFFLPMLEKKAGIIIPSAKLQKRIMEVIASESYMGLHNPRYSVLSNPMNNQYQNCTEFVLDIVNAAIYQTDDREVLKSMNQQYFDPQPVKMGSLSLMLGAIFMPDLALEDHHAGPVKTATFTTIGDYLEKYGLVEERLEFRL